MLCQLVLLVFISSLKLGKQQREGTDVNDMFRNIDSNLVQLKNLTTFQMKEVLSLRADLSSLNDSVRNLSMRIQEHKQQTAVELAQLHTQYTSLNATQYFLTQQVNNTLNTITASLSQYQRETTYASSLETANFKLDLLANTTAQLSTDLQQIQDMECVEAEKSLQLHQNLQSNLTHQLETIQSYVLRLYGPYTCGGTRGWRRLVYLDMTDPSTTCPSGWQLTGYSKRTCGRASDGQHTCDSVTFPVSGGDYSKVCGRVKAYQWGITQAFYSYHYRQRTSLDGAYVDGISVTHSTSRQHIWTFAAGISEGNQAWTSVCPCDADVTIRIPPFVGSDYFCESGVSEPWGYSRQYTLYSNDTLWDGENCLSNSTCCSLHNPPYFVKQLPTTTTDDIEVRLCLRYPLRFGNIAVELVELYVQ